MRRHRKRLKLSRKRTSIFDSNHAKLSWEPHGCITHQGDNVTGEGEGDDELIVVSELHTVVWEVLMSVDMAGTVWWCLQGNVCDASCMRQHTACRSLVECTYEVLHNDDDDADTH